MISGYQGVSSSAVSRRLLRSTHMPGSLCAGVQCKNVELPLPHRTHHWPLGILLLGLAISPHVLPYVVGKSPSPSCLPKNSHRENLECRIFFFLLLESCSNHWSTTKTQDSLNSVQKEAYLCKLWILGI